MFTAHSRFHLNAFASYFVVLVVVAALADAFAVYIARTVERQLLGSECNQAKA
jgi:hypothetical protein